MCAEPPRTAAHRRQDGGPTSSPRCRPRATREPAAGAVAGPGAGAERAPPLQRRPSTARCRRTPAMGGFLSSGVAGAGRPQARLMGQDGPPFLRPLAAGRKTVNGVRSVSGSRRPSRRRGPRIQVIEPPPQSPRHRGTVTGPWPRRHPHRHRPTTPGDTPPVAGTPDQPANRVRTPSATRGQPATTPHAPPANRVCSPATAGVGNVQDKGGTFIITIMTNSVIMRAPT
jgi:hypothetical protein